MPGLYVTIEFEDISAHATDYFHRSITLSAPNWEASVGRSTSGSQGLKESPHNALFSSRVVSRDHARLRADPETRLVTIEDLGSMHGTHVDGRRLQPHEPEPIYGGSNVIFGAEVERIERGSSITFQPKKVEIYFSWSDEAYEYDENPILPTLVQQESRNSFNADYSDDEPVTPHHSDENEESRSPNIAEISRTFTVPDESSDVSDEIISIISDEDASEAQSPISSPVGSIDLAENPSASNADTSKAPPFLGTGHQQEPIDISEDDSYYEDSSIFEGHENDEEDDHLEEGGYERSPNSKITVNIPVIRPREPSPSDAAMVKPAATFNSSQISQQLPVFTTFQPSHYDSAATTSPFSGSGRNEGAWAGHNSVLYEPVPVSQSTSPPRILDHFFAPLPSNQAPSRSTTGDDHLIRMSSKPTCCFYEPVAANIDTAYESSVFQNAPEVVFSQDVLDEIPELADHLSSEKLHEPVSEMEEHVGAKRATLAAINAETSRQLKSLRTRKAYEMSADNPIIVEQDVNESVLLSKDNEAVTRLSSMRVPESNKIKLSDSIESPLSTSMTVEPPKKKTKKSIDNSSAASVKKSSNLRQLAATAMVSVATGVAIGAVGAIFGLASLPADFFT